MFAAPQKCKLGHVILIAPLLGVACPPWARTCYDQLAY